MQVNKERNESGETVPVENVISSLVEQWMAAFNAHDVSAISALYAADAELFDSGMRHARLGSSAITAWFTQRFRQMPSIRYTPTQLFLGENEAAICWLAQGRTPAFLKQNWLSQPFQTDGVSIFRVRSNLIIWQHGYYDHLHMAEQVLPPLRWLPLKL